MSTVQITQCSIILSDLPSVIVPKAMAKKKPRTNKQSGTAPALPPPGPEVVVPPTPAVAPHNKDLDKKSEHGDVKGKKIKPDAKAAPATSSLSTRAIMTPNVNKQPVTHRSPSVKRKPAPPSTSDSSSDESEAKRVRVHLMNMRNIQTPDSSPAASSSAPAPNPQKKKKRKGNNKGIVIPAGKNTKR